MGGMQSKKKLKQELLALQETLDAKTKQHELELIAAKKEKDKLATKIQILQELAATAQIDAEKCMQDLKKNEETLAVLKWEYVRLATSSPSNRTTTSTKRDSSAKLLSSPRASLKLELKENIIVSPISRKRSVESQISQVNIEAIPAPSILNKIEVMTDTMKDNTTEDGIKEIDIAVAKTSSTSEKLTLISSDQTQDSDSNISYDDNVNLDVPTPNVQLSVTATDTTKSDISSSTQSTTDKTEIQMFSLNDD